MSNSTVIHEQASHPYNY